MESQWKKYSRANLNLLYLFCVRYIVILGASQHHRRLKNGNVSEVNCVNLPFHIAISSMLSLADFVEDTIKRIKHIKLKQSH